MQDKNLELNNEVNKIEKRNFITYLVTNLLCFIFAIVNIIFISLMKINSDEIKKYNKYSYLLLFQFILSLILVTQSLTYFKKSDDMNKKILILFRINILLIIILSLYFAFSVFIFFSFGKSIIKASESEIKTIIERTKVIKLITLIILAIYLTFVINNLVLFNVKNKNLFKKK